MSGHFGRSNSCPCGTDGPAAFEEPAAEPSLESIPGYDEEARIQYAGGLTENSGDDSLAE